MSIDLRRKQCWNPDIQFVLTVVLEVGVKADNERNWKTSKSSRVLSWKESSVANRETEELLEKA